MTSFKVVAGYTLLAVVSLSLLLSTVRSNSSFWVGNYVLRYKDWGYIWDQNGVTFYPGVDNTKEFRIDKPPWYDPELVNIESFYMMLLNAKSADGREGPVWIEVYLNGAKVSAQIVYLHPNGSSSFVMDVGPFIKFGETYTLMIRIVGNIPAHFGSIEYLILIKFAKA